MRSERLKGHLDLLLMSVSRPVSRAGARWIIR